MGNNQLISIVEEKSISKDIAVNLQNIFNPYFEKANEWADKSKTIVVVSEEDTENMELARESRLALKAIRCDVEKKRKEMKDEYLRTGKAIDGIANVIKYLIVPIEERLQKQEDFVKIAQESRLQEIEDKRAEQLIKYECDPSAFNLRIMSEETFQMQLKIAKGFYEKIKKEEEEEQARRVKLEAEEKLDNSRLREISDLVIYMTDSEKSLNLGKMSDGEFIDLKTELDCRRLDHIKEQKRIKAENEKLLREKERKDELLRKANEKARLLKDEADKKKKEAEEIEKKRLDNIKKKELAPDKEKLIMLANEIASIKIPNVKSKEVADILSKTIDPINKIVSFLKESAIKL